jgi:hypothetical protein
MWLKSLVKKKESTFIVTFLATLITGRKREDKGMKGGPGVLFSRGTH